MVFGHKKKMIDIGELQRQGKINPVSDNSNVIANKEGFIELGNKENKEETSEENSNIDFFNMTSTTQPSFSEETNGYSKREVDVKIQELDNKLYKMEQRIELLERKAGINNNSNEPMIGW